MPKENTFVCIQSFMVDDLGLKGNELIVFAVIYGYTQDGDHWYYGTRSHLAEWCGASKGTVTNCLNSLLDRGYIIRREVQRPGHTEVQYQARICTPLPNFDSPPTKNCNTPLPKIGRVNNIGNKDKDSDGPSLEEVTRYMVDNGANARYAEQFFNHYESQGWKKGNGLKLENWMAAAWQWLKKDGIEARKTYPDSIPCGCGGTARKTATFKSGSSVPYYRCDACGETRLLDD